MTCFEDIWRSTGKFPSQKVDTYIKPHGALVDSVRCEHAADAAEWFRATPTTRLGICNGGDEFPDTRRAGFRHQFCAAMASTDAQGNSISWDPRNHLISYDRHAPVAGETKSDATAQGHAATAPRKVIPPNNASMVAKIADALGYAAKKANPATDADSFSSTVLKICSK
ncbi:hypothetical protein PC9H_006652 [Pleurotus ostreatus]|uniref:Uncharacterized protein n=1 Tax=Pleurotus ostreatus TaxID=5322 RepID=A0A8H7DVT0_PLEOS|nr:uncharacterized protein PC9H_006652 [Pleurotus ostreatus]KAF7430937.1 hypothetical protein PC9H_006652 [Pleurotus ostreatus]